MKYGYIVTLTGAGDGLEDIGIPAASFYYRQKNGARSTLRVVVPGTSYFEAISARSNGELVISLTGNGSVLAEVARANLDRITPNYGVKAVSVNLEGTKQATYTPAAEPHDISSSIFYYAPNQSNGLYTFHLAGPHPQIIAGDDIVYGDLQITIGDVIWQVDPDRTVIYLSEETPDLGSGSGDSECLTIIDIGDTTSGTLAESCYFDSRGHYYHNISFSVLSNQWITVDQPDAPPFLSLYLTFGVGLESYDGNGDYLPGKMIAASGGVEYYAAAGDYTVQVYSSESGTAYSVRVRPGQLISI